MSLPFLRHVDIKVAEPFKRTSRSGQICFSKRTDAPKTEKHLLVEVRFRQPIVYGHLKAEVTGVGLPVTHFFQQLTNSSLEEG